jgi:hypothetical protein
MKLMHLGAAKGDPGLSTERVMQLRATYQYPKLPPLEPPFGTPRSCLFLSLKSFLPLHSSCKFFRLHSCQLLSDGGLICWYFLHGLKRAGEVTHYPRILTLCVLSGEGNR